MNSRDRTRGSPKKETKATLGWRFGGVLEGCVWQDVGMVTEKQNASPSRLGLQIKKQTDRSYKIDRIICKALFFLYKGPFNTRLVCIILFSKRNESCKTPPKEQP